MYINIWVVWDAELKCSCESECKAQLWLCCSVYKLLGDSMWPPKRVAKLKCGFVEMCISYGRLKCGPPAMYGSDVAQMWIKRDTKLCETQMWIMGEKQISLCRSPTLKFGRKNVQKKMRVFCLSIQGPKMWIKWDNKLCETQMWVMQDTNKLM